MPERRCKNCGHRAALHFTFDFRCRLADNCLCAQWTGDWSPPPQVWRYPSPSLPESGADAYEALIDSVHDLIKDGT